MQLRVVEGEAASVCSLLQHVPALICACPAGLLLMMMMEKLHVECFYTAPSRKNLQVFVLFSMHKIFDIYQIGAMG